MPVGVGAGVLRYLSRHPGSVVGDELAEALTVGGDGLTEALHGVVPPHGNHVLGERTLGQPSRIGLQFVRVRAICPQLQEPPPR